MAFLNPLSTLFGKDSNYSAEYKRFKSAMARNSGDHGLKAQFIKFCLLNRFTKHETMENHIVEALALFETIDPASSFDLQCHYLVGKYYQEDKDNRKAYQVYLNALKLFNRRAAKDPGIKAENSEMAFSIALNLMTLQSNPIDPEVEICFKLIRKSYPLHVKRIEMENEMAKPAPDKARIKQLAGEIRKLKEEEEKEAPAPEGSKAEVPSSAAAIELDLTPSSPEKNTEPARPGQNQREDIFTKLFRVPSLDLPSVKQEAQSKAAKQAKEDKKDVLKFSPVSDSPNGVSFMVFQHNDWEGPFTMAQLRAQGFLDPSAWVCRVGSQLVTQAYEVPDLHSLIQHPV